MRRRYREESHDNHDRWIISYADFITLLFAFFVVMYSISSVNDGKYRVLSDSLVTAFDSRSRTLDPVSVGDNLKTGDGAPQGLVELPVPGNFPSDAEYRYSIDGLISDVPDGQSPDSESPGSDVDSPADVPATPAADQAVDPATRAWQTLSSRVEGALGGLLKDGDARIVDKGEWLEVNIQSSVLFDSGEVELSPSARQVLLPVARLLASEGRLVQVEGHTDNLAIDTEKFPSNWELSAARSASVVRWFVSEGISGNNLSAIGYGEFRPVADNGSVEGRRANRRISILVARDAPAVVSVPVSAEPDASGIQEDKPSMAPRLLDYRLTNADLSRPLPKGGPPVPLRFERISLDQARERWQIQRSGEGGAR
jgi:chemotaxis protein MotB